MHVIVRSLKINDLSKTTVSLVLMLTLIWLLGCQEKANVEILQELSACDEWEYESAKEHGYYDSKEAYAFGKKMQELIRDRDLEGFFSLVEGELRVGPRKKVIKRKTFDEVFSENWVREFLSEEPPCSHFNLQGFTMPNIWYQKRRGKWTIISIFNTTVEAERPPGSELVGWRVNGRLLHPECFTYEWLSSDNFKEFYSHYFKPLPLYAELNLPFSTAPGLYLGKTIKDYTPISPSWCEDDEYCEKIYLAHSIENCTPVGFDQDGNDGIIVYHEDSNAYDYYEILATVSVSDCAKLAPNLDVKCESSFLLEIVPYGGGSMVHVVHGIYGVFDLDPIGLAVVPLRYFDKYNDGLNFLDELAFEAN